MSQRQMQIVLITLIAASDCRLWSWRDEHGVERGPESDAARAHY